jgi:alkylation response protein AidB-like acyl-CoA dehydrogenase
MLWKLTEEQEAHAAALRGWLDSTTSPSQLREWLDNGDLDVFAERFVADGLSGVGFGDALGGQGGGLVELALTAEAFGRSAAPSGGWLATVLAVPALAGRPDRAARALGGATIALCVPAEEIPDLAPALAIDGHGLVTGSVPRVLAADRATDLLVVVERDGARELRLVDVERHDLEITPHRLLDRSRTVADIGMKGVPSEALDVDVDAFLTAAAAHAAVLVAADSLGAAQRMLDLAVAYSLQRKQFGVPIGSFQAVKHAAATVLVGVEAARSIVYFAAASVDGRANQHLLHAAAAKAQVTADGARAADVALTMHGAIGYTWEHDLHLFYKRAKLDEHLFGGPRAWNERIASGLDLDG